MTAEEVFIPIDRKKMILMTVIYSLAGIVGLLIVYYLGENQDWVSPTIFKVISVIVFLFFIVVAGSYGKNIKNSAAGLTINLTGIDDQSSSISHGLIKWKDVTGISKVKTASSKLLVISVKKPKKYLDNAKNSAVKRVLNQNISQYKTPIVINVGILDTSLEELEILLKSHSGKFGHSKNK